MLPFLMLVFLVGYFSGCSTPKNYKILSFFFDGVPLPKNDITTSTLNGEINSNSNIDSTQKKKSDALAAIVPQLTEFVHKPFGDKDCNACHELGRKVILKMDVPDLCYSCHKKFDTLYTELHGPVAGGMCNSCHQPHNSKFQKLLITENNSDLCYNCHVEADILQNPVHKDKSACLKCHNPHGGKTNKFLK